MDMQQPIAQQSAPHPVSLADLSFEEHDGVGIITFNDLSQKVNTLNSKLIPQFEQIFAKIEVSKTIKAVVVISGKKDCFIAGADISELSQAKSEEEVRVLSRKGQEFFNRIDHLKQPVVCAINGSCLGGGLELALACDYRIATFSSKTVLGLPEVMLGLIPGAGGTQRLPRLIGLEKALSMMLTGSQIKPERAKKLGLIDYVCPPEGLLAVAKEAAKQLASGKKLRPPKKGGFSLMSMMANNGLGQDFILKQAEKQVLSKTKGLYPAPLAIIRAVRVGLREGINKGLAAESHEFAKLSQTSESRGLISLYFAQTELKKNPYADKVVKVEHLGVLGAGLMGAGISYVSVQKGMHVRLKDVASKSLSTGHKYIWDILSERVKKKSMTRFEADQIISRLTPQLDYQNFSQCQMVIEAVFEDLKLKHRVLAEVEAAISDDCIFASNTSALPITDIAQASKHPERVIGMHYFSPVHKMPLLEIIATDKTNEKTIATAIDVGQRQGKTVIVVKDGPGFYTTRILAPLMDEAGLLLLEGNDFHHLDKVMQKIGFPVGPITLMDEVGLDVAYHVGKDLGEKLGKRVSSQDPEMFNALIAQKSLGRKSGAGFFLYAAKKPNKWLRMFGLAGSGKEINPKAVTLIQQYSKGQKKHSKDLEMSERMCFRMVNEAVYCLHEGILSRPLDGDIGAVFGLGFPPFTGGPFRYVDSYGVAKFVDQMNMYADKFGERFEPCALLKDMARDNKKFYA